MQLKDILSNNEIEQYHEEWKNFRGEYNPEPPYNVHSNMPVIGKVFQYKDEPIFRAKILKNTIKKINPYNINQDYPHANFHLIHYLLAIEQIGHASLNRLIDNYNQFIITDRFNAKEPIILKNKIHFDKNHPSIELIADLKQGENRTVGRIYTAFYEDFNNNVLQRWSLEGIGELREYAKSIKKLKEGYNLKVAEELIKKIECRNNKRKKTLIQRTNLPDKNFLIEQLCQGQIPEAELHDFFSFWDKTE